MKHFIFLTFIFFLVSINMNGLGICEEDIENTFEYSGIDEIEIEGEDFNIQINGYSGNSVKAEIFAFEEDVELVHHEQHGGNLHVWVETDFFFPPLWDFDSDKKILLHVPYDVEIKISNSSGNITVSRINSQELNLESASGDIKLKDCKTGNQINISTASGDIRVEEIEATDFELKATSGDVLITNCQATLDFDVISGDIHLKYCRGRKRISTKSGEINISDCSGDINADSISGDQEYEEINGDIKAKSTSGAIDIHRQIGTLELESLSGDLEGNNIQLTANSSFQTISGSIEMDFNNPLTEIYFKLNTTSGSLSIGKVDTEGTLSIGQGSIVVTGSSVSGDQEYR